MMYNKFLTIRKENDYNYRFYATKRKYVYWTLITLNVRMFLIFQFQNDKDSISKYFFTYKDKIVYEVFI